jgi:hypothetical protein
MTDRRALSHEFVEYIPTNLEELKVYISIPYATVVHRCCCGCGYEVVTPLSPADWSLTYDGVSVSLDPSIGNWSLPCRSHYWITESEVRWAPKWSNERIAANRESDALAMKAYYADPSPGNGAPRTAATSSWLSRAWRRLRSLLP